MYIPDAVLLETGLNHEEIASGCSQLEFLVQHCPRGFVKKGQLTQHETAEQHGHQSH